MRDLPQIGIIILAGGKSSRMGRDKGLMTLAGKSMIEHVIEVAQQISQEIIIIANNDEYKKFSFPVYKDDFPEKGPLGGIYTGLKNSNVQSNLILSCDIPFLQKNILEFIISFSTDYDISIASFQGKLHPLIGVYSKSCESVILESIEQNKLKVTSIFEKLKTKHIDVSDFDSSNFRNINSESDL